MTLPPDGYVSGAGDDRRQTAVPRAARGARLVDSWFWIDFSRSVEPI